VGPVFRPHRQPNRPFGAARRNVVKFIALCKLTAQLPGLKGNQKGRWALVEEFLKASAAIADTLPRAAGDAAEAACGQHNDCMHGMHSRTCRGGCGAPGLLLLLSACGS
jgi:hypothetical protein